ncbi:MAG: ATP-binding protein, partial [Victivallaceae bacterium]|nr:ATP-binding protein [Victivallaceae bacterium]
VKDSGPGLNDKDKEKLFKRFAKMSAKPTGGEHSTGLGLSIVKKLVDKMHGKVWCESEEGNGAEFKVELPRFSS